MPRAPTAIRAPDGQRTLLTLDANGYLASVTNPAGESTGFTSTPGGLLTALTTPRGDLHQFAYDALGRLTPGRRPGRDQSESHPPDQSGHGPCGQGKVHPAGPRRLGQGGHDGEGGRSLAVAGGGRGDEFRRSGAGASVV